VAVAVRDGAAYRALAQELRAGIARRDFADGRRLPTEAELSASRGVSRQTVRRAFQELVAEGAVYRVPGRGTFATPPEEQYLRQFGSVEDLMGLSQDTDLELVEPLHPRTDRDAATRLGLAGDAVVTAVFTRWHGGTPFCVTTVHLPPHLAARLDDVPELTRRGRRGRPTVIGLVDDRLEAPIAEADQAITVSLASAGVARQLDCAPGKPLLRIERLYTDVAGRPVELALSEFLPEAYTYRVRLRRTR
jgi:GntR family transcriptional regulator